MSAMKISLLRSLLLGLCFVGISFAAYNELRIVKSSSETYPHAGRIDVKIGGSWGTICASDWDLQDAEVACRQMGLGLPNKAITSRSAVTQGSGSKCLSQLLCYGHESNLGECSGVQETTRTSSTWDRGIICYPATPTARLVDGPNQYEGYVEVKVADGSWSKLYSVYASRFMSSICRQLGYGQGFARFEGRHRGAYYDMTVVSSCPHYIWDPRSCEFHTYRWDYQRYLWCHSTPGTMEISLSPSGNGETITSPNYPSNYYNYGLTQWEFRAPPNSATTVHFNSFRTERVKDYVMIYSANINTGDVNDARQIGLYSGSSVPADVTTDDYLLWIIFTSNWDKTYRGFSITVTSECTDGVSDDGRTCTAEDIDECVQNIHNCDVNATCENTEGSFTCTCNQGYSGNGVTCEDTDECELNVHNCDVNAACENTEGSFTCTCNQGYSGNGVTCEDIDECALNIQNCDSSATCENTEGHFTCTCYQGYSGNGVTCRDINECTAGTHNCDDEAYCTNTIGSYRCTCRTGFTGNGFTCNDIDECTARTHNCDNDADCTNTIGSYTCTCHTGFTGNGFTCNDIDECTARTHNCDADANCTNTNGSYTCTCHTGFTGNGLACYDINECTVGTHNCDAKANCTNTNGSYTCTCHTGFTGNGFTCNDTNECTTGAHNCDAEANCTNTNGSYTCTCHTGFTGNGFTCSDMNECTAGTHNCDDRANCTNTKGSYTCTCQTGFTGNGFKCTDTDECTAGTHNCDADANCTNTIGSYACTCYSGFTGNGFACNDIDECTAETHSCDAEANCTNTNGSYTCFCNTGFTGNGFTCNDADECIARTHNCDAAANCRNTIGSYTCTCYTGFTGNGFKCNDTDECTAETHNCDADANCTNTIGSYTCTCQTGFTGNGFTCDDIDECREETHSCDVWANCTNTFGSYTCICHTGFTGDGFICNDNRCSTPVVPRGSSIRNQLSRYNVGDEVLVKCDIGSRSYTLRCEGGGSWSGPNILCHNETGNTECDAPVIPGSSIQDPLPIYNFGDEINVTCDSRSDWFVLQCDGSDVWRGDEVICPSTQVPRTDCILPSIPTVASIVDPRSAYISGEVLNVTCNDGFDWFIWKCQKDGQWQDDHIQCGREAVPPGDLTIILVVVGALLFGILTIGFPAIVIHMIRPNVSLKSYFKSSKLSSLAKGARLPDLWSRGPLPELPDGYAKYVVGDQPIYVDPDLPTNDQTSRNMSDTTDANQQARGLHPAVQDGYVKYNAGHQPLYIDPNIPSKNISENTKDTDQRKGPLPNLPNGYAKYIAGEQHVYADPNVVLTEYPMRNVSPTFETYEAYEEFR